MKKLFFLTIIFFILGVLFARFTLNTNAFTFIGTDPGKDNRCLQITVKFNADDDWRKSNPTTRYIYAGCDGEGTITNPNNNPPGCTGGLVKLKPGDPPATLGRCSCFNSHGVTGQEGCLKIGKKAHIEPKIDGSKNRRNVIIDQQLEPSNTCKVIFTDMSKTPPKPVSGAKYFCGTNEQRFSAGVNISCTVSVPTPTNTPTPTPTIPVPTPTNTPTPTTTCPVPGQVLNVKVTCPNCQGLTPTPIPTAATRPECNKVDPTYSGRCNVETNKCRYTLYETTGGTTTDVCDDVNSSFSCTQPEDCPQPTPVGGNQ